MSKLIDLTGQKFGRFLVTGLSNYIKGKQLHWYCICSCGKTKTIRGTSLKRGYTRSCGCIVKENARRSFRDLTGRQIGHWVVIRQGPTTDKGLIQWLCRCECGTEKLVFGNQLKVGRSRSCGCRRMERFDGKVSKKTTYEYQRNACLKNTFGITLDDYKVMLGVQGGKCAICLQPETFVSRWGKVAALAVDHNWKTGKIRGLLCRTCNTTLGKFLDDPERFDRAAAYLRRE